MLEANKGKATTVADIEDVLDGNLCRCTGYRPIFDAFKSMATGTNESNGYQQNVKVCSKLTSKRAIGKVKTSEGDWMIPTSVNDLVTVLDQLPQGGSYRLVDGNTGRGIYDADTAYETYISLKAVKELVEFTTDPLVIGAGMSLTSVIDLFEEVSSDPNYKYCQTIADHIKKVAHPSVRNAGTIGGNLMLKHSHIDFPSDLFLLVETIGAQLVIKSHDGSEQKVSPMEFLNVDMTRKFLLRIEFPKTTDQMFSYKTMLRSINTHAYVNGGLRIRVDSNFIIQERPRLVFGGISPDFIHATSTENYLNGKDLKDQNVLQQALQMLKSEVVPNEDPVMASPAYRSHLTQALLYRVGNEFMYLSQKIFRSYFFTFFHSLYLLFLDHQHHLKSKVVHMELQEEFPVGSRLTKQIQPFSL